MYEPTLLKHVCITGCTRGLGRALAEWFLDAEWTVSGLGRDADAIGALQSAAPEGRGYFQSLDVTDDAAVADFAKALAAAFGPPDLLLNNAGTINANAPLWEVPAEAFSRVVEVNLLGVANCLRHFAPLMIGRGSGVMLNLSSGWGRSTSSGVAPYCATKWAIEGLSQAMAQELPPGVAVAALNPGIIDTEMLRRCFGQAAASYPSPRDWAQRAGPYLARLDATCNGAPLTAP